MKFSLLRRKASSQASDECRKFADQNRLASQFIGEIQLGRLEKELPEALAATELGMALRSMQDYLNRIAIEDQQRSWLNMGLAQFSDILRNKEGLELHALTDHILSSLVKYVNANQGALFVLEEDDDGTSYLEMISCYAYDKKKYLHKRFDLGDGLTGQCVLEKQSIYLKQVPRNYVSITSGLGEATPRTLFLAPLLINENVFGVLELASFQEFESYKLDFINKLAESIASTIKNVKDNERTKILLEASKQQAEELRSQEEEMRQNMEEMQATQEEMERKNFEINRATAEMTGILKGIDVTMATIEFAPDGTVISANNNFLKSMNYRLNEIKGKHHSMFVPKEILDSHAYKTFWSRLAKGESVTGTFKRISSTGSTVWLNAIYNPIFNSNYEVIKVVKFATDITAEQEALSASKGILSGINETMATIEFMPDGTIMDANENFLKSVKYSLADIKGKHHRIFVPNEILESSDYKTFWHALAEGKPSKGIFKRMDANGNYIWLNAIYNPIFNADKKVIKILKLATDITAEQEKLAESKGILEGINSSMATIEFTPTGIVLNANENFLNVMKYTLEDIKGKHHKKFVPLEIQESPDYKTFWKRLAQGEPITGVFQRVDAQGNKVWLNAIYNPILNASHAVVKVIKFATDITGEQERLRRSA